MSKILGKFDVESAHRFDNVYKDLAYVKNKGEWAIARTKNVLTSMLADLEIKFEKLELKVAKLEVAKYHGSSARRGENFPGSSSRPSDISK